MLEQQIKDQVQGIFSQQLKQNIIFKLSLDDSKTSRDMEELANDLAAASSKITVEKVTDHLRKPTLQVTNPLNNATVNFAGLPMGHEFNSLLLAILQVGGHPIKADQETIEQIQGLAKDLNVEIYVSLDCHNCPTVVQAFNAIAVNNSRIKVTTINGVSFQDEVNARNIMAVPTIYINGELFDQGRMTLAEILSKLDSGAEEKIVAKLNKKAPFDVLVIGGGPSGASAAIYAARKGIVTGIIAERSGGQILDTSSIENFISQKSITGTELAKLFAEHMAEYNIDNIADQKVAKIIDKKTTADGYIHIVLANGAILRAKAIVIAAGAAWRNVNVPGEQEYRNKGVAYCTHCDAPLYKGKNTVVIGGGNSGIEAAIDLAGVAQHVTVVEFANQLRADQTLLDRLYKLPNVEVVLNAQTTRIDGNQTKVVSMSYTDRLTNTEHTIPTDGVFVQIGLVPNTVWAKDSGVAVNARGEIEVGSRGETNLEGVFAAGDCTTIPYKQIIISMGDGAKASLGAFDYLIRNN